MPRFEIWHSEEDNALMLIPIEELDYSVVAPKYKDVLDGHTFVHAFEAEDWLAAKDKFDALQGHDTKKPRRLPAVGRRVECGAIQFGDDWPGLFIRGDDAFFTAVQIKLLIDHLDGVQELGKIDLIVVRNCLEGLSKDIDRHVTIGGPRLWPYEEDEEE